MAETLETIAVQLKALDEKMDHRFTSVDQRVASMDQRFTSIDDRLAPMDQRFTSIDDRLAPMDQRFTSMDKRFTSIDERVGSMDGRFDRLEKAVREGDENTRTYLGVRMDLLSHQVRTIFEKVEAIDQRQVEELEKFAGVDKTLERQDPRILALETRREKR
jgi:predicted  nucleic acid-binding Zn-ribbon protein